MNQIKLGFAGLARSGKDTCAEYVVNKYGGKVMKFAQPLYDIMYFAQDRTRLPRTKWRRFLQLVGTELFREEHPTIWIDLLLAEVAELPPTTHIAISDLRFTNEFEALKKEGFILVKLERPEKDRMAAETGGISQEVAAHASEQDVLTYQGFNHVILNTGTLEQLYGFVDKVIELNFGPIEEFTEPPPPSPSKMPKCPLTQFLSPKRLADLFTPSLDEGHPV